MVSISAGPSGRHCELSGTWRLGLGPFSGRLSAADTLGEGAHQMGIEIDREHETGTSPAEPYVAPALTLIGNLHQLLASGGTKDADQTVCTPGTGTDVDPSCM